MNLEAFRDAVLSEARAAAREQLDRAERDARERIDSAREQASEQISQARREGRETARRDTLRKRADARRRAREQVLRARREVVDELRQRVLDELRSEARAVERARLGRQLRELARRQLGADAEIDEDMDGDGLVARRDGRRVDYRLTSLVDRALDDMGTEVEELWQ